MLLKFLAKNKKQFLKYSCHFRQIIFCLSYILFFFLYFNFQPFPFIVFLQLFCTSYRKYFQLQGQELVD